MDSLARAVEAADGFWPVMAITVIGAYVLLWRLALPVLKLLRENTAKTHEISQSIITNHGSKNIGDAVDRLTESVWRIEERLQALEDQGNEEA